MYAGIVPPSSSVHSLDPSSFLPQQRCWSTTTQNLTGLLPVIRLHIGSNWSMPCYHKRCQTGKRGQVHLLLGHCRLWDATTLKWRKKLALACVFAVKKFYSYIFSWPLMLLTDYKPLLTFFRANKPISPQASVVECAEMGPDIGHV